MIPSSSMPTTNSPPSALAIAESVSTTSHAICRRLAMLGPSRGAVEGRLPLEELALVNRLPAVDVVEVHG